LLRARARSRLTRSASSPIVSVSTSCIGLQPDRQRLDILHRHDPQAQRLERLAGAELVEIEHRLARRKAVAGRRGLHLPGAKRFAGELACRQAKAAAGLERHLPLVPAHIGLQQAAGAKLRVDDDARRLFGFLRHIVL
jgi:hypothetical protein